MIEQSVHEICGIDTVALQRFVVKRLRPDGGFAATPMQPHTIQDTFFAIEILSFLRNFLPTGNRLYRQAVENTVTRDYLHRFIHRHHGEPVSARTAYQLLCLSNHFDFSMHGLQMVRAGERGFRGYEERYCLAILQANRGRKGITEGGENFLAPRRTVREVYFYIRWRRFCRPGEKFGAAGETTAWLARCQGPDGGFGFFPGTTSFVENTHYGLAALTMLGQDAARSDRAENFLISCQTGSGGFSRSGKAAPFLDASWHAVQAIRALRKIRSNKKSVSVHQHPIFVRSGLLT